jgi:hypothetical protein
MSRLPPLLAAAATGTANKPPPKIKRTLLFREEIDEREKKRLCTQLVESDNKKPDPDKSKSVCIWRCTTRIASLQLEYMDEPGLRKAGYVPPGLVGSSTEPICIDE